MRGSKRVGVPRSLLGGARPHETVQTAAACTRHRLDAGRDECGPGEGGLWQGREESGADSTPGATERGETRRGDHSHDLAHHDPPAAAGSQSGAIVRGLRSAPSAGHVDHGSRDARGASARAFPRQRASEFDDHPDPKSLTRGRTGER